VGKMLGNIYTKFEVPVLRFQHHVFNWRNFPPDYGQKADPASPNGCRLLLSLPRAIRVDAEASATSEVTEFCPENRGRLMSITPSKRAYCHHARHHRSKGEGTDSAIRHGELLLKAWKTWQSLRCTCAPWYFGDLSEIKPFFVMLLAHLQAEHPIRSFHKTDLASRSLGKNRLNFGIPAEY